MVLGHYGRKSRAEDVHVDPVVTRTISASVGSGDGLGTELLTRNHLWQGGCDGSLLIQLGRAAQNVHRILVTEDGQKIGFTSPMHILKPLAAKAD